MIPSPRRGWVPGKLLAEGETGCAVGWLGRSTTLLACGVLVAATACGTERAPGAAKQAPPADLYARCGEVVFDSLPADPSALPPLDQTKDPFDLTRVEAERETFDNNDWYVASRTDSTLVLLGTPQRPDPSAIVSTYASAKLTRLGQAWAPERWGSPCHIVVAAPGLDSAPFVLDPDVKPDPAAGSISVLAWMAACATSEGRRVRTVVVSADETSVSIVVLVQPRTEDIPDCLPNTTPPVKIDLGAALGDRAVRDASVQPARERPWPPTQASLDNQGYDYGCPPC